MKIVIAFISFFFVSNLQVLVSDKVNAILHWHQYLLAMIICVAIGVFTKMIIQADRASYFYVAWYSAFIGICALSLLLVKNDQVAIDQFINYSWFAGLSCTFLFVIQRLDLIVAAGIGVFSACMLKAGISIFEFLNPDFVILTDVSQRGVTEVGSITRSPGLHLDANRNGHAMVLSMFVAQFFISKHLRLLFMLFIGVAVLVTFSRSSMLAWGLAVFLSTLFGYHGSGGLITRAIGLAALGAIVFVILSGMLPQIVNNIGLAELVDKNMLDRLSGNIVDQADDSTLTRKQLAQTGWQMYSSRPLLGAGLGATAQLLDTGAEILGGVHNTLLDIAAELGTLGAIAFLSLAMVPLLVNSSASLLFTLLYFFTAMFAHTQLEEAFVSVLLPMGVLFLNRHPSRGSKRRGSKGRSRRRRRRTS